MNRREIFKDLLASFSLANLIAIPQWELLFSPEYAYRLYMDLPDPGLGAFEYMSSLMIMMLAVLSLGGIIFLMLRLFQIVSNGLAKGMIFFCFVLIFTWLANVARYHTPFNAVWIQEHLFITSLSVLLFLSLLFYCAASFNRQALMLHYVRTGVLIASPFIVVTYFTAAQRAVEAYHYHTKNYAAAGVIKGFSEPSPKIVWLLFDELDIQLAFEMRANDISLKALDDFKKEAVFASKAYAAGHWTMVSVPSMLYGRNFVEVKPISDSTLKLLDSNAKISFSNDEKSLFQALREKKVNAGIVGCFHPYMRLFGQHLAACSQPWNIGEKLVEHNTFYFTKLYFTSWISLFDSFPGMRQLFNRIGFGDKDSQLIEEGKKSANLYSHSHKEFLEFVRNPELGFLFAHYLLPHPPAFYHKTENRFCVPSESDYSGNLVLVDKTLAEIKETMMKQGTWDSSVVIIVSDHGLRPTSHQCLAQRDLDVVKSHFDERVPFLIKMPFQHSHEAYDRPVNTTVIYGLVQGIVDKKVQNVEDVIGWLDAYSVKAPFSLLAEQNQITEGVFK